MAAVEAVVLNALMGYVASLGLGLPVAWPNVDYTPPADGKYIAATFLPNGAGRVAITSGTAHRRIGLLQLTVYWPRGEGMFKPMEQAAAVADSFATDQKIVSGGTTIRITKAPDIAGPIIEEHAAQVPVTVSWEAFA